MAAADRLRPGGPWQWVCAGTATQPCRAVGIEATRVAAYDAAEDHQFGGAHQMDSSRITWIVRPAGCGR